MHRMKELTVLEQIILSVIWSQKDEAYGVSIRQRVKKISGKNLNYGTLYNNLEQLLRKGYVTKSQGESTPERIGRPRIFYALTSRGKKALWEAYKLHTSIWNSIPDFIESVKP
jgi:DNA-binding PadR family transcriptional regulator